MGAMLLLVGLGNPGPKYAKNRHNIGFHVMDAMASGHTFGPWRKKFQSDAAEGEIGGVRALLLKPQTFYNEAGNAVAEAMRFFKRTPADVVAFHDEIDLAPGRFRMKRGGGAAGNNGIRSIAAHIGEDFRRGRLGVGHPGEKDAVQHYVLGDFAKADQGWVDALIDACVRSASLLAAGEDEKYQAEVLRLAPAEKAPPRGKPAGDEA
jgi:PTH1 family peptidyl-tRNA hydrolase